MLYEKLPSLQAPISAVSSLAQEGNALASAATESALEAITVIAHDDLILMVYRLLYVSSRHRKVSRAGLRGTQVQQRRQMSPDVKDVFCGK